MNASPNPAIIGVSQQSRAHSTASRMATRRNSFLGLSKSGFHRISYCDWGDPSSKHIVVCVHGLTRNARDFDALAMSLQADCRVVCPDLAGRGKSEWLADKSDYGYPQYGADMTALLARVTAHHAADATIDWVGTSVGGLIGMLLAAQPGSPIRRLVMNDIGPLLPRAAIERIMSYVGKATDFRSFADAEQYVRTVSAPFGPLTDAQWRHLTEHSVSESAAGAWRLNYDPGIAQNFDAMPAQDIALWEVWDNVRCPVLVLRGMESDLLTRATADAMCRRGPPTRIVEFEGVGHAPALMAAEQIASIRDFLLEPDTVRRGVA